MIPPDVSVIIAAWKAADFVERAVRSALQSRGVIVEVVVVDDASPDRTFAVLKDLAAHDPRVIVDRLPANGGPSVARNRALALATGHFIAVLDADDEIEPDRLARLVTQAERRAADIVVDNMKEVDERGRMLASGLFLKSPAFSVSRTIDLATWVCFNQPMKQGDCLGYLKPLIRKSTLDRLNAAYDPALRNSEDYYLIADLLAQGARMLYMPEAGYRYTRSTASTSYRLKPEQTRAWLEAEARFMRRHGAVLSTGQQQFLARRGRTLRHVDQLIAATDALKSRQVGEFFRLLVSDLDSSAYTLATFARVATGKLLRRAMS
jgi:succinoglycan biosynthesis protein ExoO